MPSFLRPGILDVVDILVVAWLLYRFLLLIQGTRAAYMVVGLLLLMVGSVFAQLLNLRGLSWMISSVRVAWVVAVAVIFQPELRRGLAQLGQNPVVRRLLRTETPHATDEIVEAASILAGKGYGALIVVERNVGLKTYMATGRPINAEVTAELLVTVFTPGSPLHDGAVMIQGNQLLAAACILPLSGAISPRGSMGMRHLAAVSITEETDAVAVVVSEESRKISLAVNGKLERGLDPEALRARLRQLWVGR